MGLLVSLTFLACSKNDDDQPSVDCSTISGATFTSSAGKVANLLETKCGISGCHAAGGSGAAHWQWQLNYAALEPHFDHMLEEVQAGTMPPAGATPLTTAEKDLLLCWKASGFPE